jgi:hypothetical protein
MVIKGGYVMEDTLPAVRISKRLDIAALRINGVIHGEDKRAVISLVVGVNVEIDQEMGRVIFDRCYPRSGDYLVFGKLGNVWWATAEVFGMHYAHYDD